MKNITACIGASFVTLSTLLTFSTVSSSAFSDMSIAKPPDSTHISPDVDLDSPRAYSDNEDETSKSRGWNKAIAPVSGIWQEFRSPISIFYPDTCVRSRNGLAKQ